MNACCFGIFHELFSTPDFSCLFDILGFAVNKSEIHFNLCDRIMHGFFRIVSILLIGTQISAVSISEILTSFNEVIDYYFKNPDFVDLSGFFGLVRAEGKYGLLK